MGHQRIAESRRESRRKSRRKSRRVRRKEIRRISVKIVVGQIVNRRERRLLEVSARKSRKFDAPIRQISYAVADADADADADGVACRLDVALRSVAKDVPLHRRRRKKKRFRSESKNPSASFCSNLTQLKYKQSSLSVVVFKSKFLR
jgi:hypothetical protein